MASLICGDLNHRGFSVIRVRYVFGTLYEYNFLVRKNVNGSFVNLMSAVGKETRRMGQRKV